MKKLIRGSLARSLSMLLMILFMLPSLMLPLATRGHAAVGGHLNILFMPLNHAATEAPQNLSTRILQELQIALAQREGVQVTELLKNSPIMKRALVAAGDENKQDLLDKYNDAANPKLSPDARKNAAGALVRTLGVDAVVYGTIENYEFTTKPDKNRTYIKVTAHKVTVLEDETAVETPLTAIGTSWTRPDGKGDQATHDLEAIQAVAQDLAKQLTGNRGTKQPPDKKSPWVIFGNGNTGGTQTAPPAGPDDRPKPKPRSSWLLVSLLGLAVVAAVAGGGGGSDNGGGEPPPIDDGTGYAYPESDGDIRLEIVKPASWDSIAKFEIWRDALGEARGRTSVRSKVRSSRALGLVNVTNRDDAVVQNNKVILYDTNASYGYVYTYRIVIVSTSNTKSYVDIYNGQAPLMLLTAVGPYVPPPVQHVYAPPSLVANGRATLYWYMPGESLVQPPSATYAMPSYVSSFCVQVMDEGTGNWLTIASGIGKNTRSVQVPVPTANTAYRYTVRAVSSTASLMFPLDALSTAQQNQVIALVTSDQGYQPDPPQGLSVASIVNTPNPDQINMRLTWTAPSDQQVTGYNIYRRVAGTASVRSLRPTARNVFSTRRSRAVGDMELLTTVTGRTTTTWTDTSLSGAAYGTAYIYTVTSLAFNNAAESTGIDRQITVAPVAPSPRPTLTLIPDPDDPQAGAFQLQWSVPTDTNVYGYRLWRAESAGSGSLRGPRGITNERGKLPGVLGGRGQRGRAGVSLRATRVDASYSMVFETVRRSQVSYIDTDLVADMNYTYVLQYLYLGTTEGGPDSQPVSRVYDVLPNEVTNLQLTYPDGTVYLNWNAPTTNVDGSPLDDPQEFRVYRSTTLALQAGATPTVDAATLATSFTAYATVAWGSMNPRSYHDTASFPPRSVTSYVVVPVDAANQTSPGPYRVVQLSLMPPSQQVTITPGLVISKAGDPVRQLVATVLGTDGSPLPDISVTLTCSPTTAGSLSTTQTGTFTQQIQVTTDVSGTATFYWMPPTDPNTASDIGTITAVITGTSIQYVVYLSIQPPQPTGYQAVSSVNLAISQGQPSRIYFSQDVDDLLSDATVTSSVLQVTGYTATGAAAAYGRLRINADRGGFEKMAVDQVVSADRKSIVGVLDENGRMYVRFIGRVNNGITDPFIRLPLNSELGNPAVTAEDIYTSGTYPITGQVPQLVGPPYRLSVVQGTTAPATPPGWPNQNDQLPVIFQNQTTTAEATATDRLGQPVLQGMPIWFTQTWRPFNPALNPYDYNGALGHGNIAGAYSGPVSLTDANGVARAGFSSNHSGAYDVRAFALLKTFDINVLNSYNLNSTGGLPTTIPSGDVLLNNLLWNSGSGPATPERVITEKLSLLNKTLVYYDHWAVLEVSSGTNSSTTFAEFLSQMPPIIINCDGTQTARITFTATDEDSKKVLPGTPFKVFSRLNSHAGMQEHGMLQLDGDLPNVNRSGEILSFNDHSEAYVLTRGESEAPMIGTIRLRFDNLRTVQPLFTYPGYLVGHRGPSIWSVPEGAIGIGGKLASIDGDCEPSVPKSITVAVNPMDPDGNPFPGNYVVSYNGIGMGGGLVTAPLLGGETTINAADLDGAFTPGYDEVNNILPRPFMSDVIDTGLTADGLPDFSDPYRNMRVIAYGNPWEQPREDWPAQYVTVERPHRLTDLYTPNGQTLGFGINRILNVTAWNNLLEKSTMGPGWHIRWDIQHLTQDGNSTITPNPSITNDVGIATAVLDTGNKPDIIVITAYYDTDGDGLYDAGYEPSIWSTDIYIGLLDVTGLQGTAYQDPLSYENYVLLSWNAVPGATAYEVQQGGATIGTTTATFFETPHNLNPDTQYTFRVRALYGPITSNNWMEVTIRTLLAPVIPAMPTGFVVVGTTQTTITLDWNDMAGATSYDVQRSADGGTTWTFAGSPATSVFMDTVGLTAGTDYLYQVRAVNAAGPSPWTASLAVSTLP